MASHTYDALVVGSGVSGINAAYRIREAFPECDFAILEGRKDIGGTWSLFKYPGIRSDSDLFTFGFPWDPWDSDDAIATAPAILSYLRKVVSRHGFDKNIKLQHKVLSMNWKTVDQRWEVQVRVGKSEKTTTMYTKFLAMGTGYYDYTQGLNTAINGIDKFQGTVVHPQFWPENLDYADKEVVIVGSGATAVTMLPAMAEKVSRITMLQRSPGYFVALPQKDSVATFIRRFLPSAWAGWLLRLKFLFAFHTFYYWCMLFPTTARKQLTAAVGKEIPKSLQLDPHFLPSYSPWEQRLCVTPGGDFFQALRSNKATVVTGHIEAVTADGIELTSGQKLPADIIITATGLKFQMFGGALLSIDNQQVSPGERFLWRGCMLEGVPNLALYMGYTNASWTLGSDVAARLIARIMRQIKARGAQSVAPSVDPKLGPIEEAPLLGLKSNYIKIAMSERRVPKCGTAAPWQPRKSYFLDSWFAKFGSLKGLTFRS
ncbi:hypothetical protein LTR84_006629 [Exophiala bonariae]|uniref:FAD/NAD(P)-binding domain-containing protein n=1 Tax=Exophiala bonariae TaxID=1690606 RepID=A0AAV9N0K7_9EURO|nr:hypothetical protein LTR84_006629 [Exophiala bonariae]